MRNADADLGESMLAEVSVIQHFAHLSPQLVGAKRLGNEVRTFAGQPSCN
jgi:hypothetical protein